MENGANDVQGYFSDSSASRSLRFASVASGRKFGVSVGTRTGGHSRSPSPEIDIRHSLDPAMRRPQVDHFIKGLESQSVPDPSRRTSRSMRRRRAPEAWEEPTTASLATHIAELKARHDNEIRTLSKKYRDLDRICTHAHEELKERTFEVKNVRMQLQKKNREAEQLSDSRDLMAMEIRKLTQTAEEAKKYASALERKMLSPQFNAQGILQLKAVAKAWKQKATNLENVVAAQNVELEKAASQFAVFARALELRGESLGGGNASQALYDLACEKERVKQVATDLLQKQAEIEKLGNVKEKLRQNTLQISELEEQAQENAQNKQQLAKLQQAYTDLQQSYNNLKSESTKLQVRADESDSCKEELSLRLKGRESALTSIQVQYEQVLLELSNANRDKTRLQFDLKKKDDECAGLVIHLEECSAEMKEMKQQYELVAAKEFQSSCAYQNEAQQEIQRLQGMLNATELRYKGLIQLLETKLQLAEKERDRSCQALKEAQSPNSHASPLSLRLQANSPGQNSCISDGRRYGENDAASEEDDNQQSPSKAFADNTKQTGIRLQWDRPTVRSDIRPFTKEEKIPFSSALADDYSSDEDNYEFEPAVNAGLKHVPEQAEAEHMEGNNHLATKEFDSENESDEDVSTLVRHRTQRSLSESGSSSNSHQGFSLFELATQNIETVF